MAALLPLSVPVPEAALLVKTATAVTAELEPTTHLAAAAAAGAVWWWHGGRSGVAGSNVGPNGGTNSGSPGAGTGGTNNPAGAGPTAVAVEVPAAAAVAPARPASAAQAEAEQNGTVPMGPAAAAAGLPAVNGWQFSRCGRYCRQLRGSRRRRHRRQFISRENGGAGTQGIIVLTYTPLGGSTIFNPAFSIEIRPC